MSLFQSNSQTEKLILKYQQLLEEQTNKRLPDATSTEPIVGLRVWHVITEGGLPKLKSVVKPTVWPYRKALERDCLDDAGIHAVKSGRRSSGPSVADPAGVFMCLDVVGLFSSYQAHVAGEVYLWGKVTELDYGYTADFAYPKRLFIPPDFCPVKAMQLEDEYGVPCEYREEFVAMPQQVYPGAVLYSPVPNQSATAAYQQMLNAQANMQAAMIYPQGMLGGLASNIFGKP